MSGWIGDGLTDMDVNRKDFGQRTEQQVRSILGTSRALGVSAEG